MCYSLSDVPEKLRNHVENVVQSLWVSTAFLDKSGLELLKAISTKGVELRVLASTAVSSELLRELLGFANVRIIEEKFMHAKIYIADGKALIGSPNLTCPVLEGKNIEVLCEIPATEAIKIFHELWSVATPLKPEIPEVLLLRVKNVKDKIVIESQLNPGLHVEVSKFLKRVISESNGKITICPQVVKYTCMTFTDLYDFEIKVNKLLKIINEKPIDPCYWQEDVSAHGIESEKALSPAVFMIVGLHPIISNLYSDELAKNLLEKFTSEVRARNIGYIDKCVESFSTWSSACIEILENPVISLTYDIYSSVKSSEECRKLSLSQEEIESIKGVLDEIKPIFEEGVKKLYRNYLGKKKEYEKTLIEVDGIIKVYLRVVKYYYYGTFLASHKIELGPP